MTPTALTAPATEAQPQVAECSCASVQCDAAFLDAMPEPHLVELLEQAAERKRRADVHLAAVAAAVGRRSQADAGAAGLARRHGFANPARMVAAQTGGSTPEAYRLIEAGAVGGSADPAEPPRHPHLHRALQEGAVSVDAASAISTMLVAASPVADPGALDRAERDLVSRARDLPLDRLLPIVRQWRARLDPRAHEREAAAAYDARYLTVTQARSGVVRIDGRMDVQTAAPLRAALDAMVADVLRRQRDDDGALADSRTVPQVRADALAQLATHSLACDAGDAPLPPSTTVVVRVGLAELQSGVGFGEIDGTDDLVSATDIRRLAATAGVIPAVMGGVGEVLDFGRERRLYSKAQARVLAERDGGCAACHAPPSWTQVHHIRWWERDAGPTDLNNGVLLCTSCHHRIHRDGWGIEIRGAAVWFVPPAHVDPKRVPFAGGRARFAAAA